MNLGDWVRHKHTGECYSIKKICGSVVVLNVQQPYECTKFDIEVTIAICNIKNITLI